MQKNRSFPPWLQVALIVALTAAVRLRQLDVPLERDEGEYAYAGQLLLQGIPPYQLAFNMKFPGTYAAYALIMAVFGQTTRGIHLGFVLINAATILLVYLLGKRLFGPGAAVASSAAYAMLSLGQGVYGAQAHATHFVVPAVLGATLLLLRATGTNRWPPLVWSGALYGGAILMKQPGALFAIFGGLYLAWDHIRQKKNETGPSVIEKLAFFCGGVLAPLALTGLALRWAGVFGRFWFWTFSYGSEYASRLSLAAGMDLLSATFPRVVGPNIGIWLLALAGLALVWLRCERGIAVFASGLTAFSFLAVCPGLYFREHYFVLMLPAVALLAGAAVALTGQNRLMYAASAAALLYAAIQQREFLFQQSPLEISRATYGQNPFPEAIQIAGYIRSHSNRDARVAILGSEPEIPFYAGRHSVSGHIYMYGMMETQPYALDMQKEFMRDVENGQPEFVVFVTAPTSWLRQPESHADLFTWWNSYQPNRYKVVGLADILANGPTKYLWDDFGVYQPKSPSFVLVYKKREP